MIHSILYLLSGLALLIIGGNYVTDGAVAIARRLRMSALLISVTVIALGSSMPDLVVCLSSTIKHHTPLAIGDVVGANIIDLLLVVGLVCIIRPIAVRGTMRTFDMPMLALSCLAMLICGASSLIDQTGSTSFITRSFGLLLLSFFAIFITLNLYFNRTATANAQPSESTSSPATSPQQHALGFPVAVTMVILSLGALVLGGNWFVDGASGIARHLGLSEGLIGLTVVSIGSAAPDLATSLIAALKHQPDIAIGNLAGACILNVFFIIGTCAVIAPLDADTIGLFDFGTLAIGGVAVWLISAIAGRISRISGIALVLLYVAYLIKLIIDFVR